MTCKICNAQLDPGDIVKMVSDNLDINCGNCKRTSQLPAVMTLTYQGLANKKHYFEFSGKKPICSGCGVPMSFAAIDCGKGLRNRIKRIWDKLKGSLNQPKLTDIGAKSWASMPPDSSDSLEIEL